MIIDDRTGSKDLLPYLKRLGVPADLGRLEFADLAFPGRGPQESVVMVGLEVKTIGDVVQCMTSGRFAAHQLPGLIANYEEPWLIIEGHWRPSADGSLEVRSGSDSRHYWFKLKTGRREWMWREVQGWVCTMMTLGGIRVWQTHDRNETARACASIYHWWVDKAFEDHKSLQTFLDYKGSMGSRKGQAAMLRAPSFARRIYKELPGVGWERSLLAEDAFSCVQDAVNADVSSWARIDGIGPKTAEKIVRALKGKGQ